MEVKTFDAIIVGAGGAGLRCALQLAQSGLNVAVVSKVFPTRSHTAAAQGGMNAALGNTDGQDDWRWHMYDTVMGSDMLGDQDAIEVMCREAPEVVIELEHWGMPFSRNADGKIYQRAFGGQTKNYGESLVHRTCAAADRTGHALLHTLFQQNVAAKTTFLNEWFAVDLIQNAQGDVVGTTAICMETGDYYVLRAHATILATGGGGKVYRSTTNAYTCTGDGMGMAFRAGLALQDMEMWQFHPTGIAGAGVLITEGCRGEGGYLLNSDGERFMERYSPHMKDLSCRDVVSRSSMIEIREGRGCGPDKDHVLLKLDHLGRELLQQRLPGITDIAKTFAGVDPAVQPIPVVPTCHYMMGGLPTNRDGQVVTVDAHGHDRVVGGLYAAGEVACVSVHGANRLGANSLLDIVVFGRVTGRTAETAVHEGSVPTEPNDDDIDQAMARLRRWDQTAQLSQPARDGAPTVASIRQAMQNIMQEDFGVFRDGPSMASGVERLANLREQRHEARLQDASRAFNTARIEALELDNMLDIAWATAQSAMARTESRGAHARVDYPDRDDANWLKHSLIFANGQQSYRDVNRSPCDVEPIPLKERD